MAAIARLKTGLLTMELFLNLLLEFNAALDRAVAAHDQSKTSAAIVEEIRYANHLLETIAEEARMQGLRDPVPGLPPILELHSRLETTEQIVMPAAGQ